MRFIVVVLYAALAAVPTEASYDGLVADRPTAADPCGKQSTSINFEIATTADRDLAAECTELNHHLYIDSDYPSILSLPKLTSVLGFTLYDDAASKSSPADNLLTGLSFPNLLNASEIYVKNLKNVASIDVPKLAYNDYMLRLEDLPALESYNGFKLIKGTEHVEITGTGLKNINYNSLEKASSVTIEANPSLNSIELPVADIRRLSVDCQEKPLPRFSGPSNANNIYVSSCGTPLGDPRTAFGIKTMVGETSIPDSAITLLDSTFSFTGNSLSSIGFPNLTHIDGEFSISSNELSDFVFPSLRTVNGSLSFGGLDSGTIINQTTFPILVSVSDRLGFQGSISDVTLPDSLQSAPVFISSTNSDLNCSKFADHAVATIDPTKTGIQISCTAPSRSTGGGGGGGGGYSGGSGSGSSSSSSHSSGPRLRAGTIAGIVVGSVSSIISICVISWLCVSRQKKKAQPQENTQVQQYSANQVPPPLQNAPAGAYAGKPEQRAANAQALPYLGPGVHPTPPVSGTTREAELDARQRALEAREREVDLDARQRALEARERELAEREAKNDTGRI